jgi:deoxyribose-phosphate aldolase
MKYGYEELAGMIDHALLHPTLTDQELDDGCRLAIRYGVASVCIKPYAVARAAKLLAGSPVLVGTVIGFPHGSTTTEAKRYETELVCRAGAAEVDLVVNLGKALGGDLAYVERELEAVCGEAHGRGAKVKVILENDYLVRGGAGKSGDELKRALCRASERAGADWVKTSTGFGFVQRADGSYAYRGATEHDLRLMRKSVSAAVEIKASGGVRDLDGLILVRDLGATRCGTSSTAAILDEYRRREAGADLDFSTAAASHGAVPLASSTRRVPRAKPPSALAAPSSPVFTVKQDDDWLEGFADHLGAGALRSLRGTPSATLDLHGERVDAARRQLAKFIAAERARGRALVLVIVGKGRHSPGGRSVLRGEIAEWLTTGPTAHHVSAFATAPAALGGTGGIVVRLAKPLPGS